MDISLEKQIVLGEDSAWELPEITRSTIMDRRGEGVPVILAQTEKLCGVKPSYRLFGNSELQLTITAVPVDDNAALHKLALGGGVKDVVVEILKVISENPGLRVPTLAEKTEISMRTIERRLAVGLVNLVEFRGAPKTGGYYIVKKNEPRT